MDRLREKNVRKYVPSHDNIGCPCIRYLMNISEVEKTHHKKSYICVFVVVVAVTCCQNHRHQPDEDPLWCQCLDDVDDD